MWNRATPRVCPLDVARAAAHPSPVMDTLASAAEERPWSGFPGALAYVAAAAMVAVSSAAGLLIAPRWGNGPVDLLYLPAVLGAAVFGGLRPALFAAVVSTLAYNYFFTAPYHTLVIHSAADVVTVAGLFAVAVVTSHLAGSLRAQARLAAAHAARNATIAGLARRLLSCSGEKAIAEITVAELARLFNCNAVLATGTDNPQLRASAPGPTTLAPSDLAAATLTLTRGEAAGRGVVRANLADWTFYAIASSDAVLAAAGLARSDGQAPVAEDQRALLGNLLDQVALALERASFERDARDSIALRERDKLRSALLSSIGEDVKPRLAAIAASARALKRGGTAYKAEASTIAEEAAKLDRYVDNLIDLRPGGEQEPIAVGPLTIDLHRRSVQRDGRAVHLTPKEFALLAELAKQAGRVLTHAQLLRAVWGPAQADQIDYLRVAVRALRQKLERDPGAPTLILNEPAIGYRLATN